MLQVAANREFKLAARPAAAAAGPPRAVAAVIRRTSVRAAPHPRTHSPGNPAPPPRAWHGPDSRGEPSRSCQPASASQRQQRADHPFRRTIHRRAQIPITVHNGGSARGYQAILVPLAAVSTPGYGPTDGQPAEYLYIAALEVNVLNCRIGRALIRRDLDATAAPFDHSIDGRLDHHDLQGLVTPHRLRR